MKKKLTAGEEKIYDVILSNPRLTQQEIADNTGLTRSTIAVHIKSLAKKGYILGREYILSNNPLISILGTSNVNMFMKTKENLALSQVNPAKFNIQLAGIARNIAEILTRLTTKYRFFSVVGDDFYGDYIMRESKIIGMNMAFVKVDKTKQTGVFTSITTPNGDLFLGLTDVQIYEQTMLDYTKDYIDLLTQSDLIYLDATAPKEGLLYLLPHTKKSLVFFYTATLVNSNRVCNLLPYINIFFAHTSHIETMLDKDLSSVNQIKLAMDYILNQGIEDIWIINDIGTIYYANLQDKIRIDVKLPTVIDNIVKIDEAFIAGIMLGKSKKMDFEATLRLALKLRLLVLIHGNIDFNLSDDGINKINLDYTTCAL